jgi:alkanesulfonate monooxygenase SsuD/methylene tetrahydromethanopterin reductase-like flavin-dependent oxidoreductase (luciferase family)
MRRLGFGVAALVPHEVLRELAAALYGLGYDDAWSNDLGPGGSGDGVAALAALAQGAPALRLGLGVAALDKRPPEDLAAAIGDHGLAAAGRLALGIGAGFSPTPLRLVRDGVPGLRRRLPDDVVVAVAAMGPRMCRLAGELADAVLLNWMTPERIAWARRLVRQGAEAVGRDPAAVEVAAYVRVAVGAGAAERLAGEAARYASMPHYGRHFAAMGVPPGSVGVAARDADEAGAALEPYRAALDTLVVRALPADATLDAHAVIASAARPS